MSYYELNTTTREYVDVAICNSGIEIVNSRVITLAYQKITDYFSNLNKYLVTFLQNKKCDGVCASAININRRISIKY